MQVLPTAPSPTVTHLMNLEAVEAIDEKRKNRGRSSSNPKEENISRRAVLKLKNKRDDFLVYKLIMDLLDEREIGGRSHDSHSFT